MGGTSGRKPHADFTIGSSVNAAVAAFTKCMADRGKTDGVRVNCIHPSLVETERQWRRIRAEMERTGLPEEKIREEFCRETGIIRYGKVEDVADLVTFIVSSRATWLHGTTIDIDGGEIPVL
jgi:3-oxoacyl-[acyl-carrier protein] reductase